MRIGIITFWRSLSNYGQLLQCWALQQVLARLGHEPYLIRYADSSTEGRKYRMFLREGLIKSLIFRIVHHSEITRNKQLKKENAAKDEVRDFKGFRNFNLNLSESVYDSIYKLRMDPPPADAYITGSDQVWASNPLEDANKAYFLDFGAEGVLRLSYAASFGSPECSASRLEVMRSLFSRFNAISVRETSGASICSQAGFDGACTVLDPTLLLTDKDYLKIAQTEEVSTPYVMLYSINIESPEQMDWDNVKEYASLSGCEVRSVSSTGHIPGRNDFHGSLPEFPTIPRWLGLMSNASMVFTTSFHGVVFSILFHRNFVYYPLEGRYSSGNERVTDLLGRLGLEGHIWQKGMDYSLVGHPDWRVVDSLLDGMRKESSEYLKQNLR